jgi:hypothetical protein
MPLPSNPQRVALSTDSAGKPQYITREWLRIFGDLFAASGTSVSTPVDVAAQLASLQGQITALQLRVTELETGYHV